MRRWSNSFFSRSALVVMVTAVLSVGIYTAIRVHAKHFSADSKLAGAQGQSGEKLEAEVITILPSGFEQQELVRPAGHFLLMFDNQSGLRPLEVRVERAGMPRTAELRLSRKTESTKVLNLPAGEYQISEASHPEWTMRLTLTNR